MHYNSRQIASSFFYQSYYLYENKKKYEKAPKLKHEKKVEAVADIIQNKLTATIRKIMYKSFVFGSENVQDECVICLCDFLEGDKVKILGCSKGEAKHFFHEDCLNDWVKKG